MSGWRPQVLLAEGAANWRHGRWFTWGMSAVVLLGVCAPLSAQLVYLDRVLDEERRWVADGGALLVASNEAGVDAQGCEALNRITGVRGAGAVTLLSSVRTSTQPDDPMPLVGVTAGLFRVLAIDQRLPGMVVDATFAAPYGWSSGSRLVLRAAPRDPTESEGPPDPVGRLRQLPDQPLEVTAVTDLSLLAEEHRTGLLVTMGAGLVADECYVNTELAAREGLRSAVAAAVTPRGAETGTVVSDRLSSGRYVSDYAALWERQPLRRGVWLAAIIVATLWMLLRWMRRADDGLYSALGAGPEARAVIRSTEWLLVLFTSAVLGLTVATFVGLVRGLDLGAVLALVAEYGLVFAALTTAGHCLWLAMPSRSPFEALKDR